MRQLSIVVTCTSRKSLPAAAGLSARDLLGASLAERADTWKARVHASSAPRRPLRELYMGEGWVQSIGLEERARAAGFNPTTYVASAGLGLRRADAKAPSYAATFLAGHADSVATDGTASRLWWSEMCADSEATSLAELPNHPALVVLSAAYSAPLASDLQALATRHDEVLVVGGGAPLPGVRHLAANRRLRAELGGSVMSLNQRIAAKWLDRLDNRALTAADAFLEWRDWSDDVQRLESWDRRPMSDEKVMSAINAMLEADSNLAWSRALRDLRSSGFACEQRRFKRLFIQAVGAR